MLAVMRMLAAALILLTTLAYAEGETYRWVDERGVVHFSDRPHPGAELVQLRPAQGFAPPTEGAAAAAAAAPSGARRRRRAGGRTRCRSARFRR